VAVVIRLSRGGAKKTPLYRVVVADSRMPRDGRLIEKIGNYDPRSKDRKAVVDEERALYWLKQGAKPSDTVRQILAKEGIWQKFRQK
jgi:small subunit ribosomal protein S16